YPLINWRTFRKLYKFSYIPLLIVFITYGDITSGIGIILFNENLLSNTTLNSGITTSAIVVSFIFIIAVISKYCINGLNKSRYYNILLTIISVSVLVQTLSAYDYSFTRLNLYMFHFIIIIIPVLLKKWREVIHRDRNQYGILLYNMSFYGTILIIVILYYQSYLETNPHSIVPHYFFWN